MTDGSISLVLPTGPLPLVRPHLRVLSLTGGGYRGLFTAAVLAQLVARLGTTSPLNERFDFFAGTSIGGLIACALAVGRSPADIAAAIAASGAAVFPPKFAATVRRMTLTPLYDNAALRAAIDACLGPDNAEMPIRDVPAGLAVCTVNWVTGKPEIYRSDALGAAHASTLTLRDVCLATSAAPTYFPPHMLDGRAPMLDGGLVANNPDTLALMEAMRRWPTNLEDMQFLSIGTAGVHSGGMAASVPRFGLGWALTVVNLMISAQERLASAQTAALLGNRYLRINHAPTAKGQPALADMDIVDASMTNTLLTLGKAAADEAYAQHKHQLECIFAPSRATFGMPNE